MKNVQLPLAAKNIHGKVLLIHYFIFPRRIYFCLAGYKLCWHALNRFRRANDASKEDKLTMQTLGVRGHVTLP
jgi:hypothetical protein